VTTQITVEASAVPLVETQSSDVSGVVTGREVSQLELNGRNFTQLATLAPGVSNQTGQDEGTVGVYGNISYSINGGRIEYNNWEIDGGDNMDNGSNDTLNVYPNVDAIAEVRVLTSNYGAQYGRNGSGTIETITKSGTTSFHGSAFEYVRNEAFNARNFFETDRSIYKKHDYGYTLGGPFYIPGHYNTSKDKTFFFWSEEWRREIVPGQVFNTQVPSDAERAGNFSDVCPGTDCPIDRTTGNPFPNNQLPSIDPNAQAMLVMIPAANAGSGTLSFFRAAPAQPTRWREELVRVDQSITEKTRFFFRYIHDSWNTVTPTPLWSVGTSSFPTVETNFVGPGVSLVSHLTVNASPTLLNEFVFSYTTDHIFLNNIGAFQRPSSLTMTGIFNNGFGGNLPGIFLCCNAELAGGSGIGEDPSYMPWNNANPTYTFRDQVSKISGNHNLYFGAYAVLGQKNEQNSPDLAGLLTFSSSNTVVGSGNAFADFLLGRISKYQQWNLKTKYYNRYRIFEPYFQDDWRVRPHLVLNLGARLSMYGTYREKYKQANNFDPAAFNPANAPQIDVNGSVTGQSGALIPPSLGGTGSPFNGIVQCGASGVPVSCMKGHLFNLAPRVGFAWDPTGKGKTSIRAAYGIFYEHTNGNEGNTESLEGSPPLVLSPTQFNIVGYTNIGGSSLLFPLGVNSIPTKAIWPYVQQWHLDVQHELMKNTVVTVAYVGSKGTHLSLQRDINQLHALAASQNPFAFGQPLTSGICSSGAVNGQALTGQAATNLGVACGNDPDPNRPLIGFGNITSLEPQANSIYHAFQISAHRTVGRLNFSLGYTYSHSIDDSSDRFDANFLDSFNLRRSRASSNFDQRHLLNISYIYSLPSPTSSGPLNVALGGWQLSGITTFQTGTPFSVTNGVFGDTAGVGNGVASSGSYADLVGNPNAPVASSTIPGIFGPLLFNPAAFAAPRGLTFGDAGRNLLYNPSRTQFDMGLYKDFKVKERAGIQFRAEAFNLFNQPQLSVAGTCGGTGGSGNNSSGCYAGPNNSAGDPSCVATTTFLHASSAHKGRVLQLSLKVSF
jgi:hypothetical protein